MRVHRVTGLAAAAFVAASLLAPSAGAAAMSSSCATVLKLDSFHIEGAPSKTKVRRGERFLVHMRVTRPGHRDPLNQGIEFEPPTSQPAGGVNVGVTIFVGEWTYFWQVGVTDENGEATLPVRVPKDSELGWGLAALTAQNWVRQDCPDIEEKSVRQYMDFVKVVR